ncbi:MAG TPA: SPOR domain-containing protein, partial [Alphaproteobacteria bacterium]|nr:SPOR domain-containing protein [Alphaproteobacteria bacterium]
MTQEYENAVSDDLVAEPRDQPDDSEPPRSRRRLVTAGITVGTALLFGGVSWYAYTGMVGHTAADGALPLIKAEEGPTKMRPEQPGGMEVPHQDKLIYGRIQGGAPDAKVEQLLPPPETPMAKPQPLPPPDPAPTEVAQAPAAPVDPQLPTAAAPAPAEAPAAAPAAPTVAAAPAPMPANPAPAAPAPAAPAVAAAPAAPAV